MINVLAVKAYGEAEFWLSGGKVILIFILFAFTFITMVCPNLAMSRQRLYIVDLLITGRRQSKARCLWFQILA